MSRVYGRIEEGGFKMAVAVEVVCWCIIGYGVLTVVKDKLWK